MSLRELMGRIIPNYPGQTAEREQIAKREQIAELDLPRKIQ